MGQTAPLGGSRRVPRGANTSISPPLHECRALLRSPAPTRPLQEPGIRRRPISVSQFQCQCQSVQFSSVMQRNRAGQTGANGASGRLTACSVRCKPVLRTPNSLPFHECPALLRSPAPTRPSQEPGNSAVPFQCQCQFSQFSSVQLCDGTRRARVGQTAPLGGSRRAPGGANEC